LGRKALPVQTIYPGGSLMKRILSRLPVLSLCLLLPLLAMIGGCDRSDKSSTPTTGAVQAIAPEINTIAQADEPMTWADAKAWCEQKGGRLPRVEGSDSWAWADREKVTRIDGFGVPGAPWPSNLPGVTHWSGTEASDPDRPNRAWVIRVPGAGGNVVNGVIDWQTTLHRVICVP